MTLTQLRYLVAIADAGLNITLAAERVHATQPGLSKQLRQLEDELGFLVFTRRGRSLDAVTPAGGQVITHARRLLAEATSIRNFAANQRGESGGQLALATTPTLARFVLPPLLADLREAFPDLRVRLEPSQEGEVLSRLGSGQIDAALLSTTGATPAGGIAVPLFSWRRVLLLPADHPLAATPAPGLQDLAEVPLISYVSAERPESSLQQAFRGAGLEARLSMTTHDSELIQTYVRTGMGVGLLAEMSVGARDLDGLVVRPAPPEVADCIAWAVVPGERVLRDYTIDLLVAVAPQLDRHDLRRILSGHQEPSWPSPPSWTALAGSIDV